MENWSARDDSPYVRPPESSAPLWLLVLAVILAIGAAGYYFWRQNEAQQSQQPPPSAAPAPRSDAAPQVGAEPARRPPPGIGGEPAKSLPTLENSDAMMRDTVVGLVGRKAFEALVYPTGLIRRIVATVDNLPRETASRRVMPLEPVPGAFNVLRTADEVTISATNSARYAPYVRVFEALDSHALVQRYVEAYPLFQRAYAELGFPDGKFNDRLLEAIEDLLAAPDLASPAKLVQPKVFYHFADPDLEGRSAGQKIMMRMGSGNAAKVKSKLREIRAELRR